MYSAGLLILLSLLVWLSVWYRLRQNRQSIGDTDTKSSPLSLAVQELVATAGGVYLSLIMLVSFLKVELPPTVTLLTVSLDPLAFLSLGLAIIQPIITRLFIKLYK